MNEIPNKWARQLPLKEYVSILESQLEQSKDRCLELEKRVENLKISRRVLMDLLEKVEMEKKANEQLLHRRKNKDDRPINPFAVVVDNSKTFYTNQYIKQFDLAYGNNYEEEKILIRNPNPMFDQIEKEEGIKIIYSKE